MKRYLNYITLIALIINASLIQAQQVQANAKIFTLIDYCYKQNECSKGQFKKVKSAFELSFSTTDYSQYSSFFVEGESHVSLEDFVQWKDMYGEIEPELLAIFLVDDSGIEKAIVQYEMGYDDRSFLIPLAFKKVNNEWKFLSKTDNLSQTQMNTFFSLINEELAKKIITGREVFSELEKNTYYNGEKFNASYIVERSMDRYWPDSKTYKFQNRYLKPSMTLQQAPVRAPRSQVSAFLSQHAFSDSEIEKINVLLDAGQMGPAIRLAQTKVQLSDGELFIIFKGQ